MAVPGAVIGPRSYSPANAGPSSSSSVTTQRRDKSLKPQTKLTVLLATAIALAVGAAAGLGTYTFAYAKGASYLTDDPVACANCHVIIGWTRSSHRSVATCNDCHTQFYLDFVEAENSLGFHAPDEALRILGELINFARKGQLALRPVK